MDTNIRNSSPSQANDTIRAIDVLHLRRTATTHRLVQDPALTKGTAHHFYGFRS